MDQNEVDALLSQIQAQTENLKEEVGAEPAQGGSAEAGLDEAAAIAEIAGEMEAPLPKGAGGGMGGGAGGGLGGEADLLGGEFAAPVGGAVRPKAVTGEVNRLLSIEVPVIVQLGQRRLNVAEVMRLAVGAIIEFQKSADEEMDLLVNNKAIGKGHAVKVGENFGIKITTIGTVQETIKKLGGF